ncbi:MAG: hypothetical protein M3307_06205, partial [Thermoproteota archaeon]|nr:hypothetical protein [Thermoproteota archaeon]
MLATAARYSHNYDASLIERLLYRVAKKWVAGYSASEAMKTALETNRHRMSAILNFLGEDITDSKVVDMTVTEYLLLMDLMACLLQNINYHRHCSILKINSIKDYSFTVKREDIHYRT